MTDTWRLKNESSALFGSASFCQMSLSKENMALYSWFTTTTYWLLHSLRLQKLVIVFH